MRWAAAESSKIHGSPFIFMDCLLGLGAAGASRITENTLPCILMFCLLGLEQGRSQAHGKCWAFHAFSLFVWWGGGAGGHRIIENTSISMHVRCLFGGPRINEHILVSVHFDCLFGGVGCAGSPRIIENTLIISHLHG